MVTIVLHGEAPGESPDKPSTVALLSELERVLDIMRLQTAERIVGNQNAEERLRQQQTAKTRVIALELDDKDTPRHRVEHHVHTLDVQRETLRAQLTNLLRPAVKENNTDTRFAPGTMLHQAALAQVMDRTPKAGWAWTHLECRLDSSVPGMQMELWFWEMPHLRHVCLEADHVQAQHLQRLVKANTGGLAHLAIRAGTQLDLSWLPALAQHCPDLRHLELSVQGWPRQRPLAHNREDLGKFLQQQHAGGLGLLVWSTPDSDVLWDTSAMASLCKHSRHLETLEIAGLALTDGMAAQLATEADHLRSLTANVHPLSSKDALQTIAARAVSSCRLFGLRDWDNDDFARLFRQQQGRCRKLILDCPYNCRLTTAFQEWKRDDGDKQLPLVELELGMVQDLDWSELGKLARRCGSLRRLRVRSNTRLPIEVLRELARHCPLIERLHVTWQPAVPSDLAQLPRPDVDLLVSSWQRLVSFTLEGYELDFSARQRLGAWFV